MGLIVVFLLPLGIGWLGFLSLLVSPIDVVDTSGLSAAFAVEGRGRSHGLGLGDRLLGCGIVGSGRDYWGGGLVVGSRHPFSGSMGGFCGIWGVGGEMGAGGKRVGGSAWRGVVGKLRVGGRGRGGGGWGDVGGSVRRSDCGRVGEKCKG
ncbi:hypothetical protein Tco_0251832 [Tanacetum coccineum]